MNAIYNMIFLVLIFAVLVGFDYLYSIGDIMTDQINAIVPPNNITTAAFNGYEASRDMLYTLVTSIVAPFLIFLSFFSSVVNRNQNIIMYLIQVVAILMVTPLVIYVFSELLTNLLSVSILDPAYMATLYFSNFMIILVANSLMGLMSFIFVQRTATVT